jgi:catechol 2,3-dioxygenase-like lactoylglutathione lyase family enzyme
MKTLILLLSCSLVLFSGEPKRPRVLGVAQIALNVSDVEKSRAFYKDFLGFSEPFWINRADGSLALTFIKINDYQYIELFPGLKPGEDRLNHIALYTDDAEAMRVWLDSRGFKVPEQVRTARSRILNFSVYDPDGHDVEFVEYVPDSWAMREKGKHISASRISARMRHVGILVGDLDAAKKFYCDILGFRETWRGGPPGKDLAWVNLTVPDGDDYIELMLYSKLPAPERRGSAHHLCLETLDVLKAHKSLEASPRREVYDRKMEPRVGTNRKRQLNLYDPDGTRVELMEPGTIDGKPTPPSTASPPRRSPM